MHDPGWALPEQPPSADPSTVVLLPPRPATGSGEIASVPEPSPPRLAVFGQRSTLADLLDGAFAVIKVRPREVIGLAAMFVLPLGLVIAIVDLGALGGDSLGVLFDPATYEAPQPGDEQQSVAGTDLVGIVVGSLLQSALVTAIAAPLARMVEAWYLGRDLGAVEAVRSVGWGWIAVVVAFVVVHVVELVGSVIVIPGVVAMVFFSITAPVIAIERIGPIRGMRRSARLVGRRFFPVAGICLMAGLVSSMLTSLLPLLPVAVVELLGAPGRDLVVGMATIAASLIAMPFVAATAILTHLDLRARSEGLDLRLALDECFR